jgi:GNAT superfamily N-acetyltransferase
VGTVTFRDLTRADIPAGLRLCRASRWNQVERDWKHLLQLSPAGCRGAEVDGGIAGTVTTVRYAPGLAWIGMVLVDPSQRGQGIGTALLDESLRLLQDVRTVWLDATPAGYEIYRKRNFEEDSSVARMECRIPADPAEAQGVSPLSDTGTIAEFDRNVFGGDRRVHLDWLPNGCVLPGHTGYAFVRPGENFAHIGPLVAPDMRGAQQLLNACLHACPGMPVIIDVPRHQQEWIAALEAAGFREQRGFVRMRKGPAAEKLPHASEYAIMGPEFG